MAGELAKFFVTISSKFDAAGLDATVKKVEELEKKSENLAAGFKIVGGALVAMAAAGTAVLFDLTKSAMESEKAQVMWNQALKQAGVYSEAASKHGIEYANSLQKLTTYTDEAILSVETMLTRFGVEGPMLDKLTKATLDLAAAKGMDLSSAADLVAKSVGSSTNALARYGITIEGDVGSTERMQQAVDNISRLFGGAAAANASTLEGKIKQLANQFDDFKEKLGASLLPILSKFLDQGMKLVDWLNSLTPQTQEAITKFILWGTAIAATLGPMLLLIAYNAKIVLAFTKVGASLKAVLLLLSGPAGLVVALGLAIAEWARYKEMNAQAENQSQIAIKTKAGMVAEMKHENDMLIQQRTTLDKYSAAYERATEKIEQNEKAITMLEVEARKEARTTENSTDIHKKAERAWGDLTEAQKKGREATELATQGEFKQQQRLEALRTETIKTVAVMGDHVVKIGDVHNGMEDLGDETDKLKGSTIDATVAVINMANAMVRAGDDAGAMTNAVIGTIASLVSMADPVTGAFIALGGTIFDKLFFGNKKPAELLDENSKILYSYLDSLKAKWSEWGIDISKIISDAISKGASGEGITFDTIMAGLKSKFMQTFTDLVSGDITKQTEYIERMKNISNMVNLVGYLPSGPNNTPLQRATNPYTGQSELINTQEKAQEFLIGEIAGFKNYISKILPDYQSWFGNLQGIADMFNIPAMASGGMVTRPTLAMIGEGGENEYVIPESKMGGLNIYIQDNYFSDDRMVDTLAEKLVKVIKNNVRI